MSLVYLYTYRLKKTFFQIEEIKQRNVLLILSMLADIENINFVLTTFAHI